MLGLLTEGLESAWLPCSLVLLVPGVGALLAARRHLIAAGLGFVAASLLASWLRFSDRGGDWPIALTAMALAGATFLLLVPLINTEAITAAVGGLLAGGASAELWEPCVGAEFGTLLNDLPTQGIGGLAAMGVYLIGVVTPLIWLGAMVHLAPERLIEPARSALSIVGGAVLATMAVATAVGLHDDIIGQLVLWSL